MKRGEIVECDVESLAFGGDGVARVDGMALFIERALPGQRLVARLTQVKKRFARGVVESVIQESPHRVEPRCSHHEQCGGCACQDLAYAEQLTQKSQQVADTLSRIGGVAPTMLSPLASPVLYAYRNKMEFAFAGAAPVLGFHSRSGGQAGGRPGPVIDAFECHLCSEQTMSVVATARKLCQKAGLAAYDPASGRGYWRHLVVRHTDSGQMLVHLITADCPQLHAKAAAVMDALREEFSFILSCVHSSRRSRKMLAFGERVHHVSGAPHVEETLLRGGEAIHYRISANSFFQTNSRGAAALYRAVLQMGEFSSGQTVLDLYCGAGGIGLFLAGLVRRVFGFELSHDAVRDAKQNAERNGLNNCAFHAGSLEQGIGDLAALPRPDVVVCNPPRSGLHEPVVRELLAMRPPRIVAVSCDPATLARDCARLAPAYSLTMARAVDLFPHTRHIETIAVLDRATSVD